MLHYCLVQREDTPLWRYCRAMPLPATLQERIELYRGTGRIRTRAADLFSDLSWFYIFSGLGMNPEAHDPLLASVSAQELRPILASLAAATGTLVRAAPSHDSYFGAPGACGAQARPLRGSPAHRSA